MRTMTGLVMGLGLAACGHSATPPAPLLRLDPADPSEACPAGGVAVMSGLDDNGDGTLQDGEVDDTEALCHGASGADGAPGDAGDDGEAGEPGEPGLDGADSPMLEELTRLDDGDGPGELSGLATEQGVLFVFQNYEYAHTTIAIGPDADTLSTVCWDCTSVPVPAGWSWRVNTSNARSGLAIQWLGPEGSAPE